MIKIPATREGLDAITSVLGEGISVNVTLIFSLERYAQVIDAYLAGLELAQSKGHDLSSIHSVASFFVSRVDTEIDRRLVAIGSDAAVALKSTAGVANARLAYELFEKSFASDRAKALSAAGANVQRPLWASTGVKDPSLPDTLYVTELAAPATVNTMPEKTLEATFDHGPIRGDAIAGTFDEARATIASIEALGISLNEVTDLLEREGVDKFIVSWNELLDIVTAALDSAR
jgi:transaldolase